MLVETQVVEPLLADKKTPVRDRYVTEVNGLKAAVILAETTRVNSKPFFFQYVMIPQPGSGDGILVVNRIDAERSPDVKSQEALTTFCGFANEVLGSFAFSSH